MKKRFLILLPSFFYFFLQTASAAEIYVSLTGNDAADGSLSRPLRSLEAARAKVRTLRASAQGDIYVYLRGGTYFLSQTFLLTDQDGGQNGNYVHYASYPGERAILSGGVPITGWQAAGSTGIYFAPSKGLGFRQLYSEAVDLPQPQRARFPKAGYLTLTSYNFVNKVATSLALESHEAINGFGTEARFKGSEAVILKEHTLSRMRINYAAHVTATDLRLSPYDSDARTEGVFAGTDLQFMVQTPFRIYFENSLDFVTGSRDWYLNRALGVLYFYPYSQDNLSRVIAPKLETILKIEGRNGAPVKNLIIEDLDFKHAGWDYASNNGYLGGQAVRCYEADTKACEAPGGISIRSAENILLRRNRIMRMGGHGVLIGRDTRQVAVSGNYIAEIQANGILLETFAAFLTADQGAHARYISLNDNIIENIGFGYDGMGIVVPYGSGINISNNQIRNVANSGISFGWFGSALRFTPFGNQIVRNDISRVMQLYCDGGAIYTLPGVQGLKVSENYIHDIPRSVWGPKAWAGLQPGLYLDMLTVGATFTNNYLENLYDGIFIQSHAGSEAQYNNVGVNFALNIANMYSTGGEKVFADALRSQNKVETHALYRSDVILNAGPSAAVRKMWGR